MDKKPPVLNRRLSGIDAAFLYLERKEIPLNIAAVAIFDGPIPFREFVANIDSKLDLRSPLPPGRGAAPVQPRLSHLGGRSRLRHQAPHLPRTPGGARRGSRTGGAGRPSAQPGAGPRQTAMGNPRRGGLEGRARRPDRAHTSRPGRRRGRSGAVPDHARPHARRFARHRASREPARRFPRAPSIRLPSRSAAPFRAPWKTPSPPRPACSAWPTGCSATAGRARCRNSPPCCRNCCSRRSASPSTSRAPATASSAGRKSISARCRRFAPRWAAR